VHRFFLSLGFATVLATPVVSQDQASVLKALMTAVRGSDFETALANAEFLGIGGQALAEAKLLYGIRMADPVHLASVMKDLERGLIGYDPRDSVGGLHSVEQYRGLVCLARAMIAHEEDDEVKFRKEVNDGFWLFPEQANLFGKLVARRQLETRMKHALIDFASPLLDSKGEETSLAALLGSRRAIMLLFWSSATPTGKEGMSELLSQTPRLANAGITLAGVNVESKNPDIAAREFQEANGIAIPWVAEVGRRGLSHILEVTSAPRAVLISQDGRVLFNGHPRDAVLWRSVRKVAPQFAMPVFR
jgi:hypothetical protein